MTKVINSLVIATRNQGKVAELRRLFTGSTITLLSLSDVGTTGDVEETGTTFAENAYLKAREYALITGHMVIADDSGLEVEVLGNRPGVLSARYGGESSSFKEKIEMLLAEIEAAAGDHRRARFVCSMAVAGAEGNILSTSTGICEGVIAAEPRGSGGFGYDPIFVPNGYDHTFGELSAEVKQEISHRAMAFKQIIPFLRDYNAV
jgi:XTP/dITP diphosphohydrolase